jgi:hypothetical protein
VVVRHALRALTELAVQAVEEQLRPGVEPLQVARLVAALAEVVPADTLAAAEAVRLVAVAVEHLHELREQGPALVPDALVPVGDGAAVLDRVLELVPLPHALERAGRKQQLAIEPAALREERTIGSHRQRRQRDIVGHVHGHAAEADALFTPLLRRLAVAPHLRVPDRHALGHRVRVGAIDVVIGEKPTLGDERLGASSEVALAHEGMGVRVAADGFLQKRAAERLHGRRRRREAHLPAELLLHDVVRPFEHVEEQHAVALVVDLPARVVFVRVERELAPISRTHFAQVLAAHLERLARAIEPHRQRPQAIDELPPAPLLLPTNLHVDAEQAGVTDRHELEDEVLAVDVEHQPRQEEQEVEPAAVVAVVRRAEALRAQAAVHEPVDASAR